VADFGAAYGAARKRISDLALEVSDEDLARTVPACPAWSVKDLVAHLTGIATDMMRGNVGAAGSEEWTAAQIEARRDNTIDEIVREWEESGAQVEGALPHIHPAAAGGTVGDIITHEQDMRGALGRPGARDTDGVEIATDTYVRWLGRRIRETGLPTIEVHAGDRILRAGKEEPVGSVSAEAYELLRGLTGRRTKKEIEGFEWSVEPDPYIDIFSSYGYPPEPLNEGRPPPP
jgi:uncharacterized protein (TIGR03083 family)